jgi:D-aspartate ligase
MTRHERFAANGAEAPAPLACVMGGMDLLRALGLAGIRCATVARPGSPPLYSRFNVTTLPWADFSNSADDLVEQLLRLAAAQAVPPVLFYEEDAQLLMVSRHRERLERAFRFVMPDAALVEDLVDKARFQTVSERLGLPVPPTLRIRPAASDAPDVLGLRFPLIVKPLTRDKSWEPIAGLQKALRVETPRALHDLWPRLAAIGSDFLAQEEIPGEESAIESYHVYVDRLGSIAGEFTGKKIRTWPVSCGHSCALTITDAADVSELGRTLTHTLDIRGVAKFDFKRAPDGRLYLLEVNPRFNLWHHLGAIAGVNLPALVYADLTGQKRPAATRARAGTRWCMFKDFAAARASGMTALGWVRFARSCEAKSIVSWDDPMPLLRGSLSYVARALRS